MIVGFVYIVLYWHWDCVLRTGKSCVRWIEKLIGKLGVSWGEFVGVSIYKCRTEDEVWYLSEFG